jgi:hypothetical protein
VKTLFKPPPADGKLTPRQEFALLLVRGRPDGVTVDELGAILHERAGKHDRESRCQWCPDNGRSVLTALQKRQLVTHRRSGVWTLRGLR